MTLDRLKSLLALPALIIGAIVAIWGAFGWVDRLVGTDKRLQAHVAAEALYHKNADSTLRDLHSHITDQARWQEAQLRGECIENYRSDLARQGLIAKRRQLGIEP